MEQKIEKIKEIKTMLMVELEKAEILSGICENETMIEYLKKTDMCIISGIIYNIILDCVNLNKNIEQVLLD